MPLSRFPRLFPISGVLFAVAFAGGLALTNGEPDDRASHEIGFFALIAIPVWTAVAGVVLYRGQRSAAQLRVGRAAAGLAVLLILVLLGAAGAATATPPGKNDPIAFRSLGKTDVHTMRLDGTHVHRLTTSKLWDSARGTRVTVASSLDRRTVLPHRIPWQAKTNAPAASVEEVDFLIDGKLRWIEHNAPYWYGSDGDWLVTSFLSAGVHSFTVRVKTLGGHTALDTHRARVGRVPAPPADLAGDWAQSIGAARAGQFVGTWHLRITPAGWRLLDPKREPSFIDVAYLAGSLLESRSPIWTNPAGPPGSPTEGNGWCDAPYPPVRYGYSVSGSLLTLKLVGSDHCGGEHIIWEGTWHRA